MGSSPPIKNSEKKPWAYQYKIGNVWIVFKFVLNCMPIKNIDDIMSKVNPSTPTPGL